MKSAFRGWWKMIKIFNTIFENSLRVLIILYLINHPINEDKISAIDFISIYNKTLGIGDEDLHGQNTFAFCEYTARRKIINESIKELVLRGLIKVEENSKGFCYKISPQGQSIVRNFNTKYSESYMFSVKNTLKFVGNKSEKFLINFINTKANIIGGQNE